jgi:hypothetical protein
MDCHSGGLSALLQVDSVYIGDRYISSKVSGIADATALPEVKLHRRHPYG